MAAIRPIALAAPVAVTTARPGPDHDVPADTTPPGATGRSGEALSTGTDSPVSADSSTSRRRRLHQAGVGGHDVALGQHQQVADDDLGGGDLALGAVADHPGGRSGQGRQGGDRPVGLDLLRARRPWC